MGLLPIHVASTKPALNLYGSPIMTTISLNSNITLMSRYKVIFLVNTSESNPQIFFQSGLDGFVWGHV